MCEANLRVYLSLLWQYFISLFIYFWTANKKNKIRNKRKRKNARNQYTCTKRTVPSEQNNGTTATAGLSSPTVSQIPTETEDDISNLNQSASFQKLNTSVVNLMDIETNQDNFFFLMNFCSYIEITDQPNLCLSFM